MVEQLELLPNEISITDAENSIILDNFSEKHWVTKANALIEGQYDLSLQEQRLLIIIASKVQPSDEEFKMYKIMTNDVIDLLGIERSTGYYDVIKKVVNGLHEKTLRLYSEDGTELKMNWVITSKYKNPGYFHIQLHQGLKPYFLHLKKRYTKYRLSNVLSLNSTYSIRLYEILKSSQFQKERSITIEELKKMLGMEEGLYKQYGHLKSKVILVAQRELILYTDIRFDFTEIKEGRRVVRLRFNIFKNDKETEQVIDADFKDIEEVAEDPKLELKNWKDELIGFGIKLSKVDELVDTYTEQRVVQNLEYTKSRINLGRVKSYAAYCIRAIQEDYASTKTNSTFYIKQEEEENKQGAQVAKLKQKDMDYEAERSNKSPEELESILVEIVSLQTSMEKNEDEIKESLKDRLIEYHKYQGRMGRTVPPSSFKNKLIREMCEKALLEIIS